MDLHLPSDLPVLWVDVVKPQTWCEEEVSSRKVPRDSEIVPMFPSLPAQLGTSHSPDL